MGEFSDRQMQNVFHDDFRPELNLRHYIRVRLASRRHCCPAARIRHPRRWGVSIADSVSRRSPGIHPSARHPRRWGVSIADSVSRRSPGIQSGGVAAMQFAIPTSPSSPPIRHPRRWGVSIAKEITGKEKSLNALTQRLGLPPAFKTGLDALYNWTSTEGVIRKL